jgi:hypothetical protein
MWLAFRFEGGAGSPLSLPGEERGFVLLYFLFNLFESE